MRRISGLDRMVQNFQHNWETNPQFRALWSGGLGLAIVVVMCACLGFAFTFAGAAASAFSPTSSSSSSTFGAPNGTVRPGSVDSNVTFPTQTVPSWGAQLIPASAPIPPSLTPAPSPTALPTPTDVPTAPPGTGGGGGGGGGCGGCSVTVTSYTLKGGTTGSIVVHTSVPNALVNIFVKSWPGGGVSPTNAGSTDSSGNGTIAIQGVPSGCSGPVSLLITTDVSGRANATVQCTP